MYSSRCRHVQAIWREQNVSCIVNPERGCHALTDQLYADVGEYRTDFSLEGVPIVKAFVDRAAEMAKLEQALLPQRQNQRQKIFVLHGLGGIGKTQLAVEFARRHHRKFSSVFWLDGSNEDTLRHSIARCASRITKGQISDASRAYSAGKDGNINAVVAEVMGWLAQPDNTDWLVVFDNVDREYGPHTSDPSAFERRMKFRRTCSSFGHSLTKKIYGMDFLRQRANNLQGRRECCRSVVCSGLET